MTLPQVFSVAGIAFGVASFAFYIHGILKGRIRPHIFTWIVWCIVMAVASAAQIVENAGAGAAVTVCAAIMTVIVTLLAFRYGEKNITRSDWLALVVCLSAIPVWQITAQPLYAVIIVTCIDAVAYYPTFRKSWLKPAEEGVIAFALGGLQFFFSLLALEKVNLTTALYPAVITFFNFALVFQLLVRRRALARP